MTLIAGEAPEVPVDPGASRGNAPGADAAWRAGGGASCALRMGVGKGAGRRGFLAGGNRRSLAGGESRRGCWPGVTGRGASGGQRGV